MMQNRNQSKSKKVSKKMPVTKGLPPVNKKHSKKGKPPVKKVTPKSWSY